MRTVAMWVLLVLLTTAGLCYAVEEDENGNIRQSETLSLEGDEPPPPPKPKVIVKERVVMQCAPGTIWSPKNRRCISEDGEAAPAPRQQASHQPAGFDDRHIFPNTKVRIRVGQCIMHGEAISCDFLAINTAEFRRLYIEEPTIVDNLGATFKAGGDSYPISVGGSGKFTFKFNYVNTQATSVQFSAVMKVDAERDLLKFSVPITK
ncbi:hypothetical protein FY034_06835 [Trichlorobacter lovleyi]|uniref:hypothetical protein n=1 Tax=Trichlorobacter lovleyi TaxID=313985 RepID=UPI002240C7A1|nr:hypothetical protein [Trichlorobacter lovleyi]QOX78650.1 hypothetical protein FY034_06835 [Trichlorobacter lovleyi]